MAYRMIFAMFSILSVSSLYFSPSQSDIRVSVSSALLFRPVIEREAMSRININRHGQMPTEGKERSTEEEKGERSFTFVSESSEIFFFHLGPSLSFVQFFWRDFGQISKFDR